MKDAPAWKEHRILMDGEALRAALVQLADAISPTLDLPGACLVGIQTGGAHLARRLADLRQARGLARPPLGVLDITLYRDDTFLGLQQPVVRETSLPFDVNGCTVVLVDDVLYTGRTIRAALDALVDFGRPRAIRLAVLVDRGLREYPIQADHLALKTDTSPDETVQVELTEMGHPVDRVVVYRREGSR
ncbi:MAG TPA: bifunctional pyr operon transcriptional regulator/uracil phosphoribosyltransferase PyrR [Myxococcota bacterium]|nr:bifunctional pyr operon transcriptional regulator/uracil phosphoribosyltransferase PyrR [Myxococcota bacterium]HQK51918.1 bifunctional pyr operon transcriptional regulator/uracil phosphoribosyltransferase PyrR [Myxococcota bacterium]